MPFNFKRAILFGLLWWLIAFITISILMFLPWFRDVELRWNIAWFVLETPLTLLWAKAYFKTDAPHIIKGVKLAVTALVVSVILDAIISVSLFIHSYQEFFGNWVMYIGYLIFFVLTIYAGGEFDATYTKEEDNVTSN